jgi:hypothetical protein
MFERRRLPVSGAVLPFIFAQETGTAMGLIRATYIVS